jgi:hypothetical protein
MRRGGEGKAAPPTRRPAPTMRQSLWRYPSHFRSPARSEGYRRRPDPPRWLRQYEWPRAVWSWFSCFLTYGTEIGAISVPQARSWISAIGSTDNVHIYAVCMDIGVWTMRRVTRGSALQRRNNCTSFVEDCRAELPTTPKSGRLNITAPKENGLVPVYNAWSLAHLTFLSTPSTINSNRTHALPRPTTSHRAHL